MSERRGAALSLQLAGLTLSRFLLTTGVRLTYPFLPALARGAGVTTGAVAFLVALRGGIGILGPLLVVFSERVGRTTALLASLLLFGLGSVVVFVFPAYWALGVTLVLTGLAKVIYDPAMQAYVGDQVPYAQRGRAIAVTELSWAGALLVGAPVIGLMMAAWGWQAPFLWLALAGIGAIFVLRAVLPGKREAMGYTLTVRAVWHSLRRHPVIWAAVVYVLLAMAANELLLIAYGQWMEERFALQLAQLGLATAVIGGAELTGELGVGWAVDRLGKRPVIIVSGLLTAVAYVAVPFVGVSLATALLMLFVVFLAFEITIVGGVPLMTEVVPGARSVVMATVIAAGSLGRMVGALLGPLLWQPGDLSRNAAAAAILTLIAIAVLARWVREGEDHGSR